MNLSDVVVFVWVARERSFTAAGRKLELPKSTVSERIARLEKALGVRLLDRTTRALRLTASGVDYLERVSPLVQGLEEASDALSEAHRAPRGVLRVGAPLLVAQKFLADLVADFLVRYPDIELELVLQEHPSGFDLVHDRLDLAIHVFGVLDPGQIVRKLGTSERLCVASPAYVRERGVPSRPEELRSHSCVVTGPSRKVTWTFTSPKGSEAPSDLIDVHISGRYAVTSVELCQRAVLGGLGIGALPTFLCIEHIKRGDLVQVMPDFPFPEVTIQVVYPSGRQLSARTRAFADLLIERAAEVIASMPRLDASRMAPPSRTRPA